MRDLERDVIPMCLSEGMGICAYGTLGMGRFQTTAGFAERGKSNLGRNGKPVSSHDRAISAILEELAQEKGSALHNVALSYCMSKAPYAFPLIGCRKVTHLQENIKGLSLSLDEEDIAKIEAGYSFDPGFPHTFLSETMYSADPPRGAYTPEDNWVMKFMGSFDWVSGPKPILPAKV